MLKAFYKSTIFKGKVSIMFYTHFTKTHLFPWYLNSIPNTQQQIGLTIH